jgi:hypothetical protein
LVEKRTTYHIEGDIMVTHEKPYGQDYLQFPFQVPEGIKELKIQLKYDPVQVGGVSNLITLGLSDPFGFRGNGHRHPPDAEVVLSYDRATPGFTPGAIHAGEWSALLAIHSIIEDGKPCRYTLDIYCLPGEVETPSLPVYLEQGVLYNAAKWYFGDLHSHTLHSDGSLRGDELIQQAQEAGLDFLAMTDHNTNSVLGELKDYLRPDQKPLIIPGVELTTFFGHALVLGVTNWVDWRSGLNGWTMEDAAREAHLNNALFILAHPKDVGTPVCTGCRWEYDQFNVDLADGLEIWNGKWEVENGKNPGSLQMWREYQETSRRITATSGSDFHSPQDWTEGVPRVYVFARNLSVGAILEGIRQGRVIVSSGPMIDFRISRSEDGATEQIGDTVVTKNAEIYVAVDWSKAPDGARLVLRDRYGIVQAQPVSANGGIVFQVKSQVQDCFWVELFTEDSTLLALTNPIYVKVGLPI